MIRFWNKRRRTSIYAELGRLMAAAFAAALACFCLLGWGGVQLIDEYLAQSNYLEREDDRRIQSLQTYVTEHGLSVRSADSLTAWVRKQGLVAIQVYRDGALVYDSNYPSVDFSDQETEELYYAWEQIYYVDFADGEAEVVLHGYYYYQFYNYLTVGALLAAFLLFLTVVMAGIRRTIRYIRALSGEIRILEGGNLEYPITVRGRDELAELAESLEAMRQSVREQAESERRLTQANQRMVTEMSHDLRTPLTSIFIFTEILRHKCRDCAPQLEEYVDKIDQKARRMKQLSDHLFEYALVTSETQAPLDPPTSFQAAFFDVFSETAAFLQQQGFSVSLDLEWKNRTVQVSDGYIARIFDNLVSNLLKYAAPAFTISARTQYGRAWAGFVLENRTRDPGDQVESTKIGLHNISAMMQNMGGRCDVEQEVDRFRIALRFPCLPSYDTDRTIPPSLDGGTERGPDEKVQKGLDEALEE